MQNIFPTTAWTAPPPMSSSSTIAMNGLIFAMSVGMAVPGRPRKMCTSPALKHRKKKRKEKQIESESVPLYQKEKYTGLCRLLVLLQHLRYWHRWSRSRPHCPPRWRDRARPSSTARGGWSTRQTPKPERPARCWSAGTGMSRSTSSCGAYCKAYWKTIVPIHSVSFGRILRCSWLRTLRSKPSAWPRFPE